MYINISLFNDDNIHCNTLLDSFLTIVNLYPSLQLDGKSVIIIGENGIQLLQLWIENVLCISNSDIIELSGMVVLLNIPSLKLHLSKCLYKKLEQCNNISYTNEQTVLSLIILLSKRKVSSKQLLREEKEIRKFALNALVEEIMKSNIPNLYTIMVGLLNPSSSIYPILLPSLILDDWEVKLFSKERSTLEEAIMDRMEYLFKETPNQNTLVLIPSVLRACTLIIMEPTKIIRLRRIRIALENQLAGVNPPTTAPLFVVKPPKKPTTYITKSLKKETPHVIVNKMRRDEIRLQRTRRLQQNLALMESVQRNCEVQYQPNKETSSYTVGNYIQTHLNGEESTRVANLLNVLIQPSKYGGTSHLQRKKLSHVLPLLIAALLEGLLQDEYRVENSSMGRKSSLYDSKSRMKRDIPPHSSDKCNTRICELLSRYCEVEAETTHNHIRLSSSRRHYTSRKKARVGRYGKGDNERRGRVRDVGKGDKERGWGSTIDIYDYQWSSVGTNIRYKVNETPHTRQLPQQQQQQQQQHYQQCIEHEQEVMSPVGVLRLMHYCINKLPPNPLKSPHVVIENTHIINKSAIYLVRHDNACETGDSDGGMVGVGEVRCAIQLGCDVVRAWARKQQQHMHVLHHNHKEDIWEEVMVVLHAVLVILYWRVLGLPPNQGVLLLQPLLNLHIKLYSEPLIMKGCNPVYVHALALFYTRQLDGGLSTYGTQGAREYSAIVLTHISLVHHLCIHSTLLSVSSPLHDTYNTEEKYIHADDEEKRNINNILKEKEESTMVSILREEEGTTVSILGNLLTMKHTQSSGEIVRAILSHVFTHSTSSDAEMLFCARIILDKAATVGALHFTSSSSSLLLLSSSPSSSSSPVVLPKELVWVHSMVLIDSKESVEAALVILRFYRSLLVIPTGDRRLERSDVNRINGEFVLVSGEVLHLVELLGLDGKGKRKGKGKGKKITPHFPLIPSKLVVSLLADLFIAAKRELVSVMSDLSISTITTDSKGKSTWSEIKIRLANVQEVQAYVRAWLSNTTLSSHLPNKSTEATPTITRSHQQMVLHMHAFEQTKYQCKRILLHDSSDRGESGLNREDIEFKLPHINVKQKKRERVQSMRDRLRKVVLMEEGVSLSGRNRRRRKRKGRVTPLRSANAFIDAALCTEEVGNDPYTDLEDFIVCDEDDVYC